MRNAYIYTLTDPRTEQVRYVGKTMSPKSRYASHLCDSKKRKHACPCWIYHLLSSGLKPVMNVIEEVEETYWQERERFWILKFRADGVELLNHTEGGDGIHNPTAETRYRMGASNRGRKLSPERCKQMSESLRGKKRGPEFSAFIAARNQGNVHSAETRAKIGEKHRGKVISENQRRLIGLAHKGKKRKPESVQKTREALILRQSAIDDEAKKAFNSGMSMREMQICGFSLRAIGRVYGLSHGSVSFALKRESSCV